MSDRIRNIQTRIKSKIQNGDEFLAVISYLPLIGWIITSLKGNKKDKLVKFHTEQAKEINIAIIVIYLFVWFIENFPLTSWLFGKNKFFYPIIETFWLLGLFLYLGITFIGIYKALNDEMWSFPYRKEIKDKIKDIIEKAKN
ncbi:MAG: hypothetical protein KatS3mg101_1125 [Patescibacteria group bacterium]|nr:MAG: hypothetical protein KatS3mg101_1125 [Patescibacteria group bacterium]